MRKYQSKAQILIGAGIVFLAAQPVQAASTQVTGVQIESNGNGIELKLTTATQQRELPQIFTINQGNALVADLLNTQLQLPSGESFRQDNPHPEIAAIEVTQFDANSVRVVVRGKSNVPALEIQPPGGDRIAFSLAPGQSVAANSAQMPVVPVQDATVAQTPIPRQAPVAPPTATPAPTVQPVRPPRTPEVLIPNPQITIDGSPAPIAGIVQPGSSAPPFLPRAIAPPVGDIAVSNIDTTPELIDLGSAAIVPRVVLREAPVREVLALLARSAGVNLIFSGQGAQAQGGQPGQAGAGQEEGEGETTISLDLENEPVQEVFNYVLQVSGLEANRVGRTVFVGTTLPQAARNIVTRTLRLNQVESDAAATFLATHGAAVQIVEQLEEDIIDPETNRVVRTRQLPPEIRSLTAIQPAAGEELISAPLVLRGLTVTADDRLNSVTLVGAPREVQVATSFLTQLDARRRQVAVNVKVVDVNLLNGDTFSPSFSFGVGDGFFVVDNGAAVFNYGPVRPPTALQTTQSFTGTPVVPVPTFGAENAVFLDIRPDAIFNGTTSTLVDGTPVFSRPAFGTVDNPFQAGVTEVTPEGIEFGFPSFFQVPSRFLASLEAQITNGSAKILTDPTLVVQEGQEATVKLTQEVVGNIISETETTDGLTTRTITADIEEAGLTLTVAVEQIDDNGFISLSVAPTVTAIGGTQNLSIGDDLNVISLLNRRELSSGLIRLRDAQTLILSGIIQESDRVDVRKVPILGDIPILGALFRSTERTNQRNEVIVLLTPQIIDDSQNYPYGYNYSPSRDVREVLGNQGFPVQGNPQTR